MTRKYARGKDELLCLEEEGKEVLLRSKGKEGRYASCTEFLRDSALKHVICDTGALLRTAEEEVGAWLQAMNLMHEEEQSRLAYVKNTTAAKWKSEQGGGAALLGNRREEEQALLELWLAQLGAQTRNEEKNQALLKKDMH